MSQTGGREAHTRVMDEVINALRGALSKLDEIKAPPDIGAHVDRAICRLREISGIKS